MRIWDIPVQQLCNKHLIAQHFEIHCIYSILTEGKRGFYNHPEVKRWLKHLGALILVHDRTVIEMIQRGFNHYTPLSKYTAYNYDYPKLWQSVELQKELLREKGCSCQI